MYYSDSLKTFYRLIMLLSVQSQNSQSYSGNTVTPVTSEMSYAFVYI